MLHVRQVLLFAFLFSIITSCKKDDQPGSTPGAQQVEILSFTPAHGSIGAEVTIKGKHFSTNKSQNHVYFYTSPYDAEVTAASATELKVKVPQGAITGKIVVAVGNYVDTSADVFTIDAEQLSITNFTPQQGPFGTSVTINGKQFGGAEVKVLINGINAPLVQRNNTQIVFTVPVSTKLTSHKLTVQVDGRSIESVDNFTVTAAGAYARWESKNTTLFPVGTSVFPFSLSFVYKNKIYWGFNRVSIAENVADYVVYDPAQAAKGWVFQNHPPADMAPANLNNATAIVHNNRVFFGTGLAGPARKSWFEFHPETNTSTALTDFPVPVQGAVSFVLNNTIYVGFGGANKDLYSFDPGGNNNLGSWTLVATAGFRELNTGNAFVLGNEVYLGRALPDLQQSRSALYKFTTPNTISRMTNMPEDVQLLSTPAFTIGNKGYFVVDENVWEYTPDANGGTWRAVIAKAGGPSIMHVAALTVNGANVVYGWTSAGALYEFKFN